MEVKGLAAVLAPPIRLASYTIPIELWSKWSSNAI